MARCKTCQHSARAVIDAAILSGVSLRVVAGQFSLSFQSVQRHAAAHIGPDLKRGAEIANLARCGTLAEQAAALLREALENYDKASRDADATSLYRRAPARQAATSALSQVRRVVALWATIKHEEQIEKIKAVIRARLGDAAADFIEGRRGSYPNEQPGQVREEA